MFARPDYDASIVNLVSALCGERPETGGLYPPLPELMSYDTGQRPVALLVIDGMGYHFLQRFPDSALARHLRRSLTSVFPTTTATAVTALALGVPAQQHAITGWFTYFDELGCVAAPLPFLPRGGGATFDTLGVDAGQLLGVEPLLPHQSRRCCVVSPHYIADSPYSRGLFADTPRLPHRGLSNFFANIERGLSGADNPFVWAYWTELDALAHQFGIDSDRVSEHFLAIDSAFSELLQHLSGSGALLVVTADHGLIDSHPEQVLQVGAQPELQRMLRLPLCGEPRAAFCYLRHGVGDAFAQYAQERLSGSFRAYPAEQLIDEGWFGRGAPAPALLRRIGDYLLLPQGRWVIRDQLLQERPFHLIGVHGGLSDQELLVPLVVCEA